MKYLLILLFSSSMFGQLTKEENFSSYRTNKVIVQNKLIASSEVYELHNEIIFLDEDMNAYLFFSLDNKEFEDLGNLLTTYSVTKRDMYSLNMKMGGSIYIRFEDKNNYLKIIIAVRLKNKEYNFPELNRIQYSRLFQK